MYYEILARQRTAEIERKLEQSLRMRAPGYDRPGRQRSGVERLGHWLAVTGQKLSNGRTAPAPAVELGSVTIRPAQEADAAEIARLSVLDERRVPTGHVLVAELNGSIITAMPLDGGHTVTDPRRATTDVVELLELRSRQLRLGNSQLADAA